VIIVNGSHSDDRASPFTGLHDEGATNQKSQQKQHLQKFGNRAGAEGYLVRREIIAKPGKT
jgi:hypothetical protein